LNPIETLILNETERQPSISLGLARVYLNATDPKLATRTWQEVMEHLVAKKKDDSVENSSTAHRSRSAVVSRSCSLPLENGTVLLLARPAERIFSNGVRLETDLRCRSNIQADFATCHISFIFLFRFGGGLFRRIILVDPGLYS